MEERLFKVDDYAKESDSAALKTVIKDTFREIKGSFGRFFAIFAIVAIGVSFIAGITASSSDMRYSSDSYYDEYNLFDFH